MTPLGKTFVVVGVVILVLLGVGWVWTRQHRALTDARRAADGARLALQGQIVAHEATRTELQTEVQRLLAENSALRAAYDEAKRAAPTAQVTGVAKLDTGHLPVHARPSAPAAAGGEAPTPLPGSPPPAVSSPPPPPCALTVEEPVSIEVSGLELQTGQGSRLLVGVAAVFRADRSVVAAGPFQSPFSLTTELQAPPTPRWGVEILGACSAQGCGPGAAVLFPPVTVLGLRSEAFLGAVASPGALLVLGGLGVRW